MLQRLRDWLLPPPKPEPFDLERWARVMGMAADAWPVELQEELNLQQAENAAAGLREWDRLKAMMQPGDSLWRFTSPLEAWRARCGREGVALVRDGAAVCLAAYRVS